jgi:hypothetical protein
LRAKGDAVATVERVRRRGRRSTSVSVEFWRAIAAQCSIRFVEYNEWVFRDRKKEKKD